MVEENPTAAEAASDYEVYVAHLPFSTRGDGYHTITVSVTENDKPRADIPVQVFVNGAAISELVTNSEGMASVEYEVTPGTKDFHVSATAKLPDGKELTRHEVQRERGTPIVVEPLTEDQERVRVREATIVEDEPEEARPRREPARPAARVRLFNESVKHEDGNITYLLFLVNEATGQGVEGHVKYMVKRPVRINGEENTSLTGRLHVPAIGLFVNVRTDEPGHFEIDWIPEQEPEKHKQGDIYGPLYRAVQVRRDEAGRVTSTGLIQFFDGCI